MIQDRLRPVALTNPKDMNQANRLPLVILILLLTGCFNADRSARQKVKNSEAIINPEDVRKFKDEVEAFNDDEHIDVTVQPDARITYITEDEVLNMENGIVLFGWPSCPWFRNAVEPLLEFAKEENATIYYLNIREIRDVKNREDDKIVTTKEGSAGYYAMLDKFHEVLKPYSGLEDEHIKRISSPTVLFIEENKAVHRVSSTVTSQTDASIKLNREQHNELKDRYRAYFE